jgi:alpha-tubulin suppressor-like RCC1 family protein
MHHTPKVFLCAGGDVFACGNSDDGQLGNGSTDMQVIPRAVAGVSSSHIDIIACGLM